MNDPQRTSTAWLLGVIAGSWLVFVVTWILTALFNPQVTDNRPQFVGRASRLPNET